VIEAENILLNNQRIADQVLEQRLLTTVQLIEALGGGWQDSTIYSPGAPLPGSPSPASGQGQTPRGSQQ